MKEGTIITGLNCYNPPYFISFDTPNGRVGKLIYDKEGMLQFEGNADESAKIFMEYIIEKNNKVMIELKEKVKELGKIIDEMQPCGDCNHAVDCWSCSDNKFKTR